MKKRLETAVDVGSGLMAGGALYAIGAPWWAYFLIVLCGACQQAVGRNRAKKNIIMQLIQHRIVRGDPKVS